MPTAAFAPTWDLFIVVFFAIIVAYSFIVGKSATLKIIIATYIAILATDGIGNLVSKLLLNSSSMAHVFSGGGNGNMMLLKILLLVSSIVVLTVRGHFSVEAPSDESTMSATFFTTLFGFLSAGLIVSTIMVYLSGGDFIHTPGVAGFGIDITATSYLARMMTDNYNVWFALPAIVFILISLNGGGEASKEGGE